MNFIHPLPTTPPPPEMMVVVVGIGSRKGARIVAARCRTLLPPRPKSGKPFTPHTPIPPSLEVGFLIFISPFYQECSGLRDPPPKKQSPPRSKSPPRRGVVIVLGSAEHVNERLDVDAACALLPRHQVRVQPLGLEELPVGALLEDAPPLHHGDLCRGREGGAIRGVTAPRPRGSRV